MARFKVGLQLPLPGITIGVDDITAVFKRGKDTGPYLIISRACGLALDTAHRSNPLDAPILWPPHSERHQLWFLRPSGIRGEVIIASASNGLVLDATTEPGDGVSVVMWEQHGEPWQRWLLEDAPDGAGYLLRTSHGGSALTADEGTAREHTPWFEGRHGKRSQQWSLALPHGRGFQ